MSNLSEIQSVSEWNNSLRSSAAEGRTVIVDFHAEWCGPCKAIAPVYAKLATQFPQVRFLRVDVDRQQPIAAKYQVKAMPTFVAIKAGKVVDLLKGANPNGLKNLVTRHAGPNPPIVPLPEDAEAMKAAGNALFQAKQFNEALEKYTEAIQRAPNSAQLYANRSLTHLKTSTPSPSLALADAKKAVELQPGWAKGLVRLGDAYLASGQEADAANAYSEAVQKAEGIVKIEAQQLLDSLHSK